MIRILGYLLATVCLHALGMLFSSLLFLVFFGVRMGVDNALAAPGFFVLLSAGFCLIGYPVKGLFVAAGAAASLGFRRPVVSALLTALWAAIVLYYYFGDPVFTSPRDGSLFAAGVWGYALATFAVGWFLARRRARLGTAAPDA